MYHISIVKITSLVYRSIICKLIYIATFFYLAIGYHILTTILSGTKNRLLYLYAEAGLNEGISRGRTANSIFLFASFFVNASDYFTIKYSIDCRTKYLT